MISARGNSKFLDAWMHRRASVSSAKIAVLALCILPLIGIADDKTLPLKPLAAVASVDVKRYMGTWYEIARYPNSFQKKCVSDTRADYSINPDGTVKVVNQCRLASKEISVATGLARQVGAANSPKLKVRFAPAWLSFIPLVWGDYWIVDLDTAYQLVAVSEPTREYLWVLSRTPKVEPAAYEALLGRLREKGFDVQKLVITVQS